MSNEERLREIIGKLCHTNNAPDGITCWYCSGKLPTHFDGCVWIEAKALLASTEPAPVLWRVVRRPMSHHEVPGWYTVSIGQEKSRAEEIAARLRQEPLYADIPIEVHPMQEPAPEQEAGEGEGFVEVLDIGGGVALEREPSTSEGEREPDLHIELYQNGPLTWTIWEAVRGLFLTTTKRDRKHGDAAVEDYNNVLRLRALITQPQEQGERKEGWAHKSILGYGFREYDSTDSFRNARPATLIIHKQDEEVTSPKE